MSSELEAWERRGEPKDYPVISSNLSRRALITSSHAFLSHLLKALASRPSVANSSAPPTTVSYLALDLDGNELDRTLAEVDATLGPVLEKGGVTIGGVWGTFDAGLEWVKSGGLLSSSASSTPTQRSSSNERSSCSEEDALSNTSSSPSQVVAGLPPSPPASYVSPPHIHKHSRTAPLLPLSPPTSYVPASHIHTAQTAASAPDPSATTPPTHILFLGSSLGNFDRAAAPSFLKSLPLRPGSGDTLLLGLDHRGDPQTIEKAYKDDAGITARWANEMWRGVEQLTGKAKGELGEEWEYTGRYNIQEGRHEAYFRAKEDVQIIVPAGEGDDAMEVQFRKGELVSLVEGASCRFVRLPFTRD